MLAAALVSRKVGRTGPGREDILNGGMLLLEQFPSD